MKLYIHRGVACGTVAAPPSKSYAHRLLIASALSEGKSSIANLEYSQDILATMDVIEALRHRQPLTLLPCRESGSTLRLMIPVALTRPGHYRFEGSQRLFRRGLSVYETIFREQNIPYTLGDGFLEVSGGLHGGRFAVDASVSSQFISGLLFALPLLPDDSVVELVGKVESRAYIDMTLDVLRLAGISVRAEERLLYIPGRQQYAPLDMAVEGDYSNAAFLDAFNWLGGQVQVTGLKEDTLQGDSAYRDFFDRLAAADSRPIDISGQIDLGPILFTMAAALHGGTFTGTRRLAIKESDRIGEMLEELSEFGVNFAVSDDSVRILPSELHAPAIPLKGHNDHRIVMSLSVLLSRFGGWIEGAEAVSKSFPSFFDCLKQLNLRIDGTELG